MEKSEMKKLERKLRPVLKKITNLIIFQERPYTCVVIRYYLNENSCLEALGFSKVCYPDQWDNAFGIEIAHSKAVAKLARMIVEISPEDVRQISTLG